MRFIPAIDILGGRAVRLRRGDYREATDYGDPVAVAEQWRDSGASGIHVVDLDAARGGDRQVRVLLRLARTGVSFQLGGGIRTAEDATEALEAGASAVVVGSAFTARSGTVDELVAAAGRSKVVAALDVRDGRARGAGWTDEGTPLDSVVSRVVGLGVSEALVTGIERDGMLSGPDVDLLGWVNEIGPDLDLIASGGVSGTADLRTLVDLPGVTGVVVGRALYEGTLTVEEALTVDGVTP